MKKLVFAAFLSLASLGAIANERIMTVKHLENAQSYFRISIEDDGLLNGNYPGWCADWAAQIEDDVPYSFKFYSSLRSDFPPGLIDKPENLDEMNWVLNQKFVGKNAGGGLGLYTSGDVQLALWTLLDNSFDDSTVGPYSQARVDKIVALAFQYGSGFIPTCRQDVGFILDPGTPQSTIIEVKRSRFFKCVVPDGDDA
jgi:hypothetical protein